jgi:hypothetical protein
MLAPSGFLFSIKPPSTIKGFFTIGSIVVVEGAKVVNFFSIFVVPFSSLAIVIFSSVSFIFIKSLRVLSCVILNGESPLYTKTGTFPCRTAEEFVVDRNGWAINGAMNAPIPKAKCRACIYGGLLAPHNLTQKTFPPVKKHRNNIK